MSISEKVTAIITGANFAAKRTQQATRLKALAVRVRREIAFNSLGPNIAGSHEVWAALQRAEEEIWAALAVVDGEQRIHFLDSCSHPD